MKLNKLTLRQNIFLALSAFSALVALLAALCMLLSSSYNMKKEFKFDLDALDILRDGIEEDIDESDTDEYAFVRAYGEVPVDWTGSLYGALDTEKGGVITPDSLVPFYDYLDFSNAKNRTINFYYHGKKYFAMYSDLVEHPVRVVYISSYTYAFKLTRHTAALFCIALVLLLAAVLLTSRRFLIPKLEEAFNAKNKAELELSHAADLQKMAVTRDFPQDPRCQIYGLLTPAREVGGDLYGCLIKDNELFFIIGDVSDKGTAAAFVMFLLSSIAYPMCKEGRPLDVIAKTLNNVLCDNRNYDMFCTAMVGCLNLDTREMRFINAGHTRMFVDGALHEAATNFPLGVVPEYAFEEETINLPEGSTVILYSDGVTEQRSESRDFFGESGLLEWWAGTDRSADARVLCEDLDKAVEEWRGLAEQSDDRAILTIKLK